MKQANKRSIFYFLIIILMLLAPACKPEDVPETESDEPEEVVLEEVDLRFVPVPGSKFIMGSAKEDPLARSDEFPQHEVVLPTFYIMEREVTNGEYQRCMDAGICTPPLVETEGPTSLFPLMEFSNFPVVGVDWYQAQTYCEFLDGRLPTEAEWEKAARGKLGYIYPWGDEEPTCDLANAAECEEEKDTERVLVYREGESPYELTEMAGNVREWTADWYAPDAYPDMVVTNPLGPEDGMEKVTRGGSFEDGPENLRTAARLPLDPETRSPLVGFRCVPVGKPLAPICQPSYRTFCDDPRIPRKPGDEPCEPGGEEDDCGGTSIANFGCPDGGLVTVTFSTPATGEVDVTVGGDGFSCEAGDGLVYCSGPAQPMETNVAVTVCGTVPDETPLETEAVTAEMSLTAIMLSGFFNDLLAEISRQDVPDTFGFCPDGYTMDEETRTCVLGDPKPCPEGWKKAEQKLAHEETVIVCVPETPESCPIGTQYSEELGCVPEDEEEGCPPGFQTGAPGIRCAPPVRRTEPCLPGYWMDTELGCCVPFEGECDPGQYLETRVDDACRDLEFGGCPACTVYDAYEGCIPVPDCDPGSENGGGGTNPNMGSIFFGNDDCLPQDTGMDGNCDPPPGDGECGQGYVETMNPATGGLTCVPGYGPGSGCPRGYILDPRTECCVPLDNPCPDGNGENPFFNTQFGEGNPFFNVQFGSNGQNPFYGVAFGDGDFNPYGADCENGEDGDPGCPPGAYRNNDGGCEYEGGGSTPPCPEGCAPDYAYPDVCLCENDENFTCPEGDCWLADTGLATCTWTCGEDGDSNPCDSDDQVWVPEYELCLPKGDDCCPPGYDYSPDYEDCMPVIQQGLAQMPEVTQTGAPCADGYEWVDGQCVLTSRRGDDRCCWTTIINVPKCIGPCKVGKVLNPATGICEEPKKSGGGGGTDPCASCSFADCNDIGTAGRCYGTSCCN